MGGGVAVRFSTSHDFLGIVNDANFGRIVLSLYWRFAHYGRHGLAFGGRLYAFGFRHRLFGRRRLRLYGRFGRLVFQPDFGRGHRFHRHHFAGVVGRGRIRRLDGG